MKLIIASNNQNKVREIKEILGHKFDEILSLKEFGVDVDPDENGTTFEKNAKIKAHECYKACGLPCLADDSGLEVDALGGAPGVYSARYAGEPCNDERNRQKLLRALDGENNRRASFTSVVVLYDGEKDVVATGKVWGKILTEERGDGGFGYDSLFYADELGKSYAEATAEEKNKISHRGKALNNLLKLL